MKRIFALLLTAVLLLSYAPAALADGEETEAAAAEYTSEEVLYGVLDHDGSTENVYAVVILESDKPCKAVYRGPFADVKNLSDTRELELKGNRVTVDRLDGRFYFQSRLKNTSLPWDIAISYTLDGKPIDASELGGRSGRLGIDISISDGGMEDGSFYDSFMVQVSITLDSQLCRNITAEGATIANSGADKQINFTAMPGTDSEFVLTADVTDFSMPGITFAAVPFSMGDALGDITELTAGLSQLTDAVSQLSDGAAQLSSGASELTYGAWQFGEGLYQLSANSESLVSASEMFLTMFETIRDTLIAASGLPKVDVNDLESLLASLDSLCAQLDESSAKIAQSAASLAAAKVGIDEAFAGVPDSASGDAAYLRSAADSMPESVVSAFTEAYGEDGYAQWLAAIGNVTAAADAAVSAKSQWQQVSEDYDYAVQTMNELAAYMSSMSESVRTLRDMIAELSGTEGGEKLDELIKQVSQLADGYAQFHEGLVAYTGGVDALAENWGSLYYGISQLSGGTAQLSDGTKQLNDGTKDIPAQVDDMLSAYTGEGYNGNSFLSPQNENTRSVQFVLTTRAIEHPADTEPAADEAAIPDEFRQFVNRLIDLFRQYK